MRSARIELASAPWQGAVLPLNDDRDRVPLILNFKAGLIKDILRPRQDLNLEHSVRSAA